jgi:AcrR family transcriptional regulator
VGRPRKASIAVATPERLLEAAEREFAVHGFAAARLEDIAERSGITRPSLLHHYESKEALYAAVVRRSFADLGRSLVQVMGSGGGFVERLRGLVRSYAAFLTARPGLAAIVLREIVAGRGPGQAILLEQVAPLLAGIERFLRWEGAGLLRPRLPLRAALMQLAAAELVRAAAGPLREPLWGPRDDSWSVARALFLAEGA